MTDHEKATVAALLEVCMHLEQGCPMTPPQRDDLRARASAVTRLLQQPAMPDGLLAAAKNLELGMVELEDDGYDYYRVLARDAEPFLGLLKRWELPPPPPPPPEPVNYQVPDGYKVALVELAAMTRVCWGGGVLVPAETIKRPCDVATKDLADEVYEWVDGGDYTDDDMYWEKSDARIDEIVKTGFTTASPELVGVVVNDHWYLAHLEKDHDPVDVLTQLRAEVESQLAAENEEEEEDDDS